MDKSFVTETAKGLLFSAEKDILSIEVLLSKKFHPEDVMYDIICFHVTMAVEKLLKSYIISNGKNIEKTHNLKYLCSFATNIDASFENIKKDCVYLNDFIPSGRYDSEIPIAKHDLDKIIKSLNNICEFHLIKATRDSANQKYEIID